MFKSFGIIYNKWVRRSGRIVVPDDLIVGNVDLYIEEFDPITGKLIHSGWEDLGSNVVVNNGREIITNFLVGTTGNNTQLNDETTKLASKLGKVEYAQWGDSTVATSETNTGLAKGSDGITDDASKNIFDVRPAELTSSNSGATFDTDPNNVLEVTRGSDSESVFNLPSGNSTSIDSIITNINSASSSVKAIKNSSNNIILFNSNRTGENKITIGNGSANTSLGFTTGATNTGNKSKVVERSIADERSSVFTVQLRRTTDTSDTHNHGADIFVSPSSLSEIGLWTEAVIPTGGKALNEDNRFFARKTFDSRSKTHSVSLKFVWTVDASRQT